MVQQSKAKEDDTRLVQIQAILKNFRVIFRSTQIHSRLVEKESGLTAAQLWMMWELFTKPGLTVSNLARALSIHQSTCSNMLDKVERKGFVHRVRSDKDQRLVRLYLTEAGSSLLSNSPKPAQGAITDVLNRLPNDALLELETGLNQFVKALKIVDKDASMQPITG